MSFHGLNKSDLSALLLIPIMGLAFFIAFIPNAGYGYPVHIDEWVHVAHNNTLLEEGRIDYSEPFTGQGKAGVVGTLEAGFHVFFSVFRQISGLSWNDIVRFMPGVIFCITVLSAYILTRKEGFGWEAALFTCMIPTTIGIMGPGFFIPMAFCLPFIPVSLYLVLNYRSWWSYLLLLVFVGFLILTHTTSAIILILMLIPCVVIYLVKEPRHGIKLVLTGVVPFLVTLPWTYNIIFDTVKDIFVQQPLPANHDLPLILRMYGYIPFCIGLLGAFWLAIKGGVKNYSLVLALLFVVAMLAVFFSLHYGVDLVYLRGIIYSLLMLGIVAGAGLMLLRTLPFPDTVSERLNVGGYPVLKFAGWIICLALIGVMLYVAIPYRQSQSYYHMINDTEYQDFTWIKENVGAEYDRAILDPWKATPFVAITGKTIYARVHATRTDRDLQAMEFLSDGCRDTDFLREHGISIVYTDMECDNPELTKVNDRVYLLEKE